MRDYDQLESDWRALAAKPSAGRGSVELLVLRTGDGNHETPQRIDLSLEDGIVGDRWNREADPERDAQVTLMMSAVARLVTDGQALHLPGDNMLVDLDLSEAALPVGSRLRVGGAILEITAEPHTGCKKFSARMGPGALRWVNLHDNRIRRLRGVNCRIIEGGAVEIGDEIAVL